MQQVLKPRSRVLGYRETQVLSFARDKITSEGRAPSYSMICDALGISTKGEVSDIVANLERKGLLYRVGAGRIRRIQLP